jgi:hypothetical protein
MHLTRAKEKGTEEHLGFPWNHSHQSQKHGTEYTWSKGHFLFW